MGSQLDCLSAPASSDGAGPHHRYSQKLRSSSTFEDDRGHKMNHHRHRVKILFLDVDGVLNGEHYGYGGVDDSLLFLLKTIIDETGCKIVLSTTWRLNQSARATLLHFMKARADINVEDIIIGDTPSLKGKKRAFEIESFLKSDDFQRHYVATKWCAVDDLPLQQQYPQFMENHFIRTNYRTGITAQDAVRAVSILNEEDQYSNSYDY